MLELPLPVTHIFLLGIIGTFAWCTWCVAYNLYVHPLSTFPGPRGAAATKLWLAYMEIYKGISLHDIRLQMHQRYGDVVRIAPNELHFANPQAHKDIYTSKNKWDKDYNMYRAFDADTASLCIPSYHAAKQRKDVLSPLFSRTSIVKLQDLVRDRVDVLCDALVGQYAQGKFSDLTLGFRCFATDVITSFCYARSFDATSAPDFDSALVHASEEVLPMLTLGKHFQVFVWFLRYTPRWLALRIASPALVAFFRLRDTLQEQIVGFMHDPNLLESTPHPIIYHQLLNPDAHKGRPLPSMQSLLEEAMVLLGAGSDTVSITLAETVFNVVNSPRVVEMLRSELRAAWPILDEPPRYEVLEKLPFLTAVLKEGLRMFPGGPAVPFVVPPEGAVITGLAIPGGTVVSQSPTFVQHVDSAFERANEFLPERWLREDAKALESSILVFSRGPRSCLGINLAYCELYLTLAHLFRRFELFADPKRPADFAYREHFIPYFTGEHLHVSCKPCSL
ncbi:putative P450 monooxygenase [Auriscalpium vulgare]|uniref:P450 monooxygenase n=1 Tax=Auriscalpium vulgare TaxID=40419 RepID=A0ACB8RV68_9AGAM|nr:putative P450 monooxygenase [Auriscalpium vulgare]